MTAGQNGSTNPEYDVALSFAGEERQYVEQVAEALTGAGARVFYDAYETVDLWGKNLYEHLTQVYSLDARHCVMFVSQNYARKVWPSVERRAAQERALRDLQSEYILPARFDDTDIPGLQSTTGYIDLRSVGPLEFAELVLAKLGRQGRANHLPTRLEAFVECLASWADELSPHSEETLLGGLSPRDATREVFEALKLTDNAERELIYHLMENACAGGLPDNAHARADMLRRIAGIDVPAVEQLGDRLGTLGFDITTYEDESHGWSGRGAGKPLTVVQLELYSRSAATPNLTMTLKTMLHTLGLHYCEEHARATFKRLDFTALG